MFLIAFQSNATDVARFINETATVEDFFLRISRHFCVGFEYILYMLTEVLHGAVTTIKRRLSVHL